MRALRANPFDVRNVISIAGRVKSAEALEAAFSSEVIGIGEVAETAENLDNIAMQTRVFSWALNYSVRDVSRIAAILEHASHVSRIAPVIVDELEKCERNPNAPSKDVVVKLFLNPNMSKETRMGILSFLPQRTTAVLGNAIEVFLKRGALPKRTEFLGVPLCAGRFEEIKDAAKNVDGLSPEEIAKQLLAVKDLYLERGVLSPSVMPIRLSARIIDNLSTSEAVKILVGMSTGTLWSYFQLAGFSEEEASELLRFKLD
jgi:hypothetical protein